MTTFQEIQVGQKAAKSCEITSQLVAEFARLSGDNNPVHLDEDYAAQTIFKKPIAHGLLIGSLVSALLGTQLPGPGAIYFSQNFEFKAPVFIGDTITAQVEVIEKGLKHKKLTLATTACNQDGKLILEGVATVLFRK